jgi:hypothetical protein
MMTMNRAQRRQQERARKKEIKLQQQVVRGKLIGVPEPVAPAILKRTNPDGTTTDVAVPCVFVVGLADNVKAEISALIQSTFYTIMYQTIAPHMKFVPPPTPDGEQKQEPSTDERTEESGPKE